MPDIRRLPPNVVNKIAAGEVIERPASVVKELVENALDAGATRVDVDIEAGGAELIRVADNGCGIAAGQLPLAVESHATSKILSAEDLFRVGTLGFRGEALASIASVSRFTLRSRPAGCDAGAELEIIGGRWTEGEGNVQPCGCPQGTTVEVRNLFLNTPVRRKFLKTTQTEMGHVAESVTRLALAHPHVHFALRHNGRTVHDLPPTEDWRTRIARFFGDELAEALIWVEREGEGGRLYGFVAPPSHNRPNVRAQYLFLNGRFIRDRALGHALAEAYRGLLLTGRFAICFLCFEVAPEAVDVNVHPTKLEVRFQDGGQLYRLLLGTLRTAFLSADLDSRWRSPEGSAPAGAAPGEAEHPAAALDPAHSEELRRQVVDWAKGKMADWGPPAATEAAAPSAVELGGSLEQRRFSLPEPPRQPLGLTTLSRAWPAPEEPPEEQAPGGADTVDEGTQEAPAPAPFAGHVPRAAALQVHDRYLVAESDEGMLVIDQHALHERILYEQLRERVLGGGLETQRLLVPEPVDLSPAEAAAALEQQELLGRLGLQIEPFGGDTVLVSSYPAMLAHLNVADVLRSVLEKLLAEGRPPEPRDLLDELLHMISCKAAVKAGDRLTPEEIAALLEQRHLVQDTHHCPHGRPTALVLTRQELDRQFLRT